MVESDFGHSVAAENFLQNSIQIFQFFGRFEDQTEGGNFSKLVHLEKVLDFNSKLWKSKKMTFS